MNPTEQAKIDVLNLLKDKKTSDTEAIKDAVNMLDNKYGDNRFTCEIMQSMDYEHLNWLNIQFAFDAQYNSHIAIQSGSNMLTPEGKWHLEHQDN